MDRTALRFPGAIIFSVIISMMLMLLPLPELLSPWRPDWIALTLIYWAITLPKRASLLLAWFTGLLVDILMGTLLGQHALAFTIVLFFAIRFSERINPQIIWQQAFLIIVVLGTYMLINLWILGVTGNSPNSWTYWLPVFSSIIIWPLWRTILSIFTVTRKTL